MLELIIWKDCLQFSYNWSDFKDIFTIFSCLRFSSPLTNLGSSDSVGMKNPVAAARLSAAELQSPQTHKVKQMPIIEAGFEDGTSGGGGESKEFPIQ